MSASTLIPFPISGRRPGSRTQPGSAPELSFVIPCFNEEHCIGLTIERIAIVAAVLVRSSEILVVDDGSSDGTVAAAAAAGAQASRPVRVIRLSRNFGKEQAIMAGLRRAAGDAVVVIDADLQESLGYLDTMLEHYRDGYEMVYTVRANRDDETWLKRMATHAFYCMVSVGGEINIPADARDYRLMDRRVVDALCDLPERNRFMKGLYGWVGFRSIAVPVTLEPRHAGRSRFGFLKLLRLGFTGLTSFTDWPLRMWTGVGVVFALMAMGYGALILARTLLFGTDVPGWSTLVVAVTFIGGIQLVSIGVLGEYLARVFTEVKGRPGYIIADEVCCDGPND